MPSEFWLSIVLKSAPYAIGICVISNVFSLYVICSRNKQCSCFQKLVHVYETQPDNTEELMLLMQEAQEYGQPPAEIINEIAPGLELDEDGMPKFDPASGECGIM